MSPRLAAFVAILFWGLSLIASKVVLRELSPIPLIIARFGIGVVFLYAILLVRGEKLTIPRETWGPIVFLGFIGIALLQLLQVHGLAITTVVNTGWLVGLIPIWTAILSASLVGERFGAAKIAGIAVGFMGALLVISGGSSGALLDFPAARGDLLILGGTFAWAVYTVAGRATLRALGALRATAASMLAGTALLVPIFVAGEGWTEYANVSARAFVLILFLGIGCTGISYYLWFAALERLEPSRVAAFLYLQPLVTFVAAMALLGERIRPATVLGGMLVLAGVVLVERAPGGAPPVRAAEIEPG